MKQEEEMKALPKETTPIDLMISRQFLIDQGKTKKAEAAWFDRLEDELDRIEIDERMQAVKAKMIEDRKQQKAQTAQRSKERDKEKQEQVEDGKDDWEDSPLPDAKLDE